MKKLELKKSWQKEWNKKKSLKKIEVKKSWKKGKVKIKVENS